MPKTNVLPTAESAFNKFAEKLSSTMRMYETWRSDLDSVHGKICKPGLFGSFHTIAKVFFWDTWVKIEVFDTDFLDEIKNAAKEFEANDSRYVEINHWK